MSMQSVAILEAAYGGADVRLAAALHNVGGFYLSRRDFGAAKAHYQRALKVTALEVACYECCVDGPRTHSSALFA